VRVRFGDPLPRREGDAADVALLAEEEIRSTLAEWRTERD
jgi:hypothetical protein